MQVTAEEAEDSNSELFSQMLDEAERGQNSTEYLKGISFLHFKPRCCFGSVFWVTVLVKHKHLFFRFLSEESRFLSSILMYCAGFISHHSWSDRQSMVLTTCCSHSGSHCGDAVTVHVSVWLYSRSIFKSMCIALESVLYISLDIGNQNWLLLGWIRMLIKLDMQQFFAYDWTHNNLVKQ